MEAILSDYRKRSRYPNEATSMRCMYEDSLWEIGLSTGNVKFDEDKSCGAHVLDALDLCGALGTTVSIGSESKNLNDENWKDWFFARIENKCIVVDTNFILRHYFSSVIAPKFQDDELKRLSLNMPRMVILEIERRGNQIRENKNSKIENIYPIEGKDKRLAFYGAKEVRDLRRLVDFDMIPMYDPSSMVEFADRAGKGFSDAWIRKEVHDMVRHNHKGYSAEKIIFMTCDLMNSMSAEAEGLTACSFSRLPQAHFNVYSYDGQIFNFIMANAVIFGKIRIVFLAGNSEVKDSCEIEGVWHGKTTSEWYSDCLRISKAE